MADIYAKKLWCENEKGDIVNIMNKSGIYPTSIEGFGATSVINISECSGYDGGAFVSTSVPVRPISLVLNSQNIDDKNEIRKAFQVKKTGMMYYSNEFGNEYKIKYRTEECDINPLVYPVQADVILKCEQPYFESMVEIQDFIAQTIGMWEFPFEINYDNLFEFSEIKGSLISEVENNGEVVSGCCFVIKAIASATNPKIEDINTHEWIQVTAEMSAGDILVICTLFGKKAIRYFTGTEIDEVISKIVNKQDIGGTNLFNNLVYGSKFLQLEIGLNEFRYSADANERNLEITCIHTDYSVGV